MPQAGRQQWMRASASAALLAFACTSGAMAQSAALELSNRGAMPITDVRLASRVAAAWGKNLLTAHIGPGQQRALAPERQEGCLYSVRVGYSDNRFERFALIDLCHNKDYAVAGRFARAAGADNDVPPTSEVSIANQANMIIRVIRMSPVGERMWGPDRLGDQLLNPGKKINVALDKNRGCQFRVYAYYNDSRVEVIRSINLCNDSYISLRRENLTSLNQLPADMRLQTTRAIHVVNQSGLQIDRVYVFPLNDRNLGEDRLGRSVLPPGREWRVDVSDQTQCLVTVLAVYQDRREERAPNLDLCAAHEPRVTMGARRDRPQAQDNPQQGGPSRP